MSQTPDIPADPDRPFGAAVPPPPAPTPRRRRRWPWVVLGILILIVLLVILAPTIASTGPVRSFVLGKVNDSLNGRVVVADWSLGWTSGIRASGVKIYDERNAEIADIPRITTQLSLLDVVRGNFNLGETQIDIANFVARIDEQGQTNFEKLAKTARPATPTAETGELPDVAGRITVNYHGTVESAGQPTVHVEPSTAFVNIAEINRPIENDLKLTFRVGDEPSPGTVALTGSVDAVDAKRVNLDKLAADQKINLANVNLAAAAPFLKQAQLDAQLGGVANGSIHATAQGLAGISTNGQIVVSNFLVGGEPLNGDTFRSASLTIPMQVTRTVVDPNTTVIKIEQLGVQMAEASVAVSGQVTQEALQRIAQNQPPGSGGKIDVQINVPDLGAIANQLPNTLKLAEGVQVTGGAFAQTTSIATSADRVTLSQRADVTASGTRNGQPIQLQPVHLETDAVMIPTGKELPDFRDIRLAMQSSFANVRGGGASLADLHVQARFDLDKLEREARQFSDLGDLDLAGAGDVTLTTRGDPTRLREGQPVDVSLNATIEGARMAGLTDRAPLRLDYVGLVTQAQVIGSAAEAVDTLKIQSLALKTGKSDTPDIDVLASADVKVADASVPRFALQRFEIPNLASIEQFTSFVPALAQNDVVIRGGALSVKTAGSYSNDTVTLAEPLVASIAGLTIARDNRPILSNESLQLSAAGSVSLANGIAANLTDLSATSSSNLFALNRAGDGALVVSMPENGAIRGNGAVSVAADLKRLNDIAQAFGGEVVAPDQPQLRSGQFNGTITLVKADQAQTSIDFAGEMTNLTVATGDTTPVENEKVTITLKALAPDDLSAAQPLLAEGKIASSFATTTITDTKINLAGGTWDMIQSAAVDVNVPDLPKLHALATAFAPAGPDAALAPVSGGDVIGSPQPAAPDEPLKISGGSMGMKINVERDTASNATTVAVSDGRINKLSIQRGDRGKPHRFDRENPITFKLAAAVTAAEKIESIVISDLAADARIVSVSMPKPVTITGLGGTVKAEGSIAAAGSIQNITPVLAILNGTEPLPYAGDFTLTQNLRNDGDAVVLVGDVTTKQFEVYDEKNREKAIFAEETVAIRNDVSVNTAAKVAKINALAIDMPASGALKLDVVGTVERWGEPAEGGGRLAAHLNGVVANLTYDLEKLWPIVKPFVATPEEPMDGVAVVGRHTKKFEITGPYFEGETHEAIRQLQVVGDLTVDRFIYPGIEVQQLEVPIYLRKGIAQTVYAGKPAAQRIPPAALFNGGTVSIGGISLDLTQPDPRLTIPEKYKLVSRATINPLLGDTLGKYVNPIFPNSERSQGLLDVTVLYCQNVALGEKLKTAESGRAQIVFSITDLDIANPLGSLMFGAIPGLSMAQGQADTFQGQIKDAMITLESGQISQDLTILMTDPGRPRDAVASRDKPQEVVMPLRFQGDVRLSDLAQSINVTLPTELLARFFKSGKDQQVLRQIFPQGVPLSLKGTTVAPKVDAGNIAQKIVEGQIQGGLGGLLDQLNRDRDKNDDRKRGR